MKLDLKITFAAGFLSLRQLVDGSYVSENSRNVSPDDLTPIKNYH